MRQQKYFMIYFSKNIISCAHFAKAGASNKQEPAGIGI